MTVRSEDFFTRVVLVENKVKISGRQEEVIDLQRIFGGRIVEHETEGYFWYSSSYSLTEIFYDLPGNFEIKNYTDFKNSNIVEEDTLEPRM